MAFKVNGTTVIDNSRNAVNIATASGTFSGPGSGVTAINASNITTGTMPAARIPSGFGATFNAPTSITVNVYGQVITGSNCNCNCNCAFNCNCQCQCG